MNDHSEHDMPQVIAFLRAQIEREERRVDDRGDGSQVECLSSSGHDRDVAQAILSQSKHRGDISPIQVEHLLRIGFSRGQQNYDRVHQDIAFKRQMIAMYEDLVRPSGLFERLSFPTARAGLADALRLMTATYFYQPDFRAEWLIPVRSHLEAHASTS